MIHVVLYKPEIPPNTGNIIRPCANTGATLHFIRPLGFELDDKRLRRAGLDYHEWVSVRTHASLNAFMTAVNPVTLYAVSTRGKRLYTDVAYTCGTALLYGPETCGLPASVLAELPDDHVLRIPMRKGSRSLNLSNAAAVMVYEAWRQLGFLERGQ
jgi:tRNA (cytidine/uridine-2'-O-)-methyltransferase